MGDLRDWIKKVDSIGELRLVNDADWDNEIGCITDLNVRINDNSALLFDNIRGYPSGYRVLSCSLSSNNRLGLTMGLSGDFSEKLALSESLRYALPGWEAKLAKFPPEIVKAGPVLEHVHKGSEIDLFEFPTPKWHEGDGGRYIGTGVAVITKDPDTQEVNLGTYRIMIHDNSTVALYTSPGKHGRIHYEKWHARGLSCPVAISVGHHPLIYAVASTALEGPEYNYIGAVRNKSLNVFEEETSGLLIPAESEIVIVGFCPPGKMRAEGPFGEWTGYYGSDVRPTPIVEVERIYHRDSPILLGAPPAKGLSDGNYHMQVIRSAILSNDLAKSGISDVRGVWISEIGLQQLIVVSLKQRYPGHAKRAALSVAQHRLGAYVGRYIVVVDEDIDPTNLEDVIWALCTRSDPEKDIDLIRGMWSSPLDPIIPKSTTPLNSRAIINACRPFEWLDKFPKAIEFEPETVKRVKQKWKFLTGQDNG